MIDDFPDARHHHSKQGNIQQLGEALRPTVARSALGGWS
jgi:hypothetical protein